MPPDGRFLLLSTASPRTEFALRRSPWYCLRCVPYYTVDVDSATPLHHAAERRAMEAGTASLTVSHPPSARLLCHPPRVQLSYPRFISS